MDEATITYNLNQICRFCLTQDGVMSVIFDEETQGSSISLPVKIMACVSIQVSEGDGLPSLICHRCLYQMERSYEFKAQCEYSDAKLRHYISQCNLNYTQNMRGLGMKQLQNISICKLEQPESMEAMSVNQSHGDNENQTVVLRNTVSADQKQSVIEIKLPPSVDIRPLSIKQESVGISDSTSELFLSHTEHQRLFTTRPHICSVCGKGFAQRRELNRHHMVHSGEKPFSCPVCSKRFARRDKVVSHLKVHGQQTSYNCFQCPAIFMCREELRCHELGHTGKQPWCCQLCYKIFFSKAELVKHRRSHREIFTCHICSLTFSQKEKLTKHMKVHSKSKFIPTSLYPNIGRSDRLTRHAAAQMRLSEQQNLQCNDDSQGSDNQGVKDRTFESEVVKSLSRLGRNPEILLFPISQS